MFLKSIGFILSVLALTALACGLTIDLPARSERAAEEAPAPSNRRAETSAAETSAAESAADPIEGAALFNRMGCAACHNSPAKLAPALDGLYGSQVTLDSGATVPADEAYLRRAILDSKAELVAGYEPIMPDFAGQLSDAQVAALVAYIRSLGD